MTSRRQGNFAAGGPILSWPKLSWLARLRLPSFTPPLCALHRSAGLYDYGLSRHRGCRFAREGRCLSVPAIAVTSDASMAATFDVYALYEQASGAKLNRGKSKGIWLGAWKSRQDSLCGIQWVKELRLLCGTFSAGDYSVPTWEPPVAKLEQRLSAWKGRQLTLQGKTTVINTLALSQIWHLCHVCFA